MLEPEIHWAIARCCQAWTVALGWPMRPCGYCGQVPVVTSENPENFRNAPETK